MERKQGLCGGKVSVVNMSKVQMLRSLVNQRLTAAAEEIFGLFERTTAEYEEELSRSKEENERQRRLLDAVFNPEVRIQRADIQQLVVVKEKVPLEQQDWNSSLDQEDLEPPHIKEEQEELWTSQEGEQLQVLEEAGIKFSFTPVKSEEETQSSNLHQRQTEQMETEADGADCGESETEDLSERETDDSRDWKKTQEPHSDSNPLQNNEVPVSDVKCSATGVKPFSCSVCGKTFSRHGNLNYHMTIHTGVKPFSCSLCSKTFAHKAHLKSHMRVHTGEKPISCSVCSKTFSRKGTLKSHMRVHTGDKPFSCSMCNKTFSLKARLKSHMRVHTGDKPFSCPMCTKTFSQKAHMKYHMTIHTGEKPFSCSMCRKTFSRKGDLNVHMIVHTREKPFSCSVCGKSFAQKQTMKQHLKVHSTETN